MRSRFPLRERPRRRAILVVVPVSSRKMSRCGSSRMRGWRVAIHSSRAALISGRSCSVASSVFFEAVAVADEKARERSGIGFCPGCRQKFPRKLRHCDVGFFFDAGSEKRFMGIELGVTPSAARPGSDAPGRPKCPHQPDGERNEHAEMRGSRATGPASLDKPDNPFTKIKRIGLAIANHLLRGSESQA